MNENLFNVKIIVTRLTSADSGHTTTQ